MLHLARRIGLNSEGRAQWNLNCTLTMHSAILRHENPRGLEEVELRRNFPVESVTGTMVLIYSVYEIATDSAVFR